ncbi:hypothetical protein DMB42_52110 [Nonomuraea sp. WAC 01424]|uniref:hypothetical protein n=1 Tax=Nonomuraea sp. WAC 01424 TaxID=2203200 RepID=UPI000F7855E6|nr:hypothetical protein [Nonomuraea sp. WAC 01424]RSM93778.1 hypothetical protein DMB42_52110 [Nonomuraea sp. WAC 01424]
MVQVRIMDNDPERVRQVAELMLPLLEAAVTLQVGDAAEIPNRRGPGLRITFDVRPARPAEWRVEDARVVDDPPVVRVGQRALPPVARRRPGGALPR